VFHSQSLRRRVQPLARRVLVLLGRSEREGRNELRVAEQRVHVATHPGSERPANHVHVADVREWADRMRRDDGECEYDLNAESKRATSTMWCDGAMQAADSRSAFARPRTRAVSCVPRIASIRLSAAVREREEAHLLIIFRLQLHVLVRHELVHDWKQDRRMAGRDAREYHA
jgi:hypothetical protein